MCAPYVEARPKGGARAEKEIGEKAQKIIRYQIVSTYFSTRCVQSIVFGLKTCLQPSFGLTMCTSVLSLNTLKTCLHYTLCGYKKESGEPSGSSVLFFKKWVCHSLDGFSSSKIARFFCCRPFGLFLPSLFGNETLTSFQNA